MKTRLIIISNRLPISVSKKGNELKFTRSVGGLSTGLESFYSSYECIWVGWPGIPLEKINEQEKQVIEDRLREEHCCPIFLSERDMKGYYYGFSNKSIWPLFHYFQVYTTYNQKYWKQYNKVNKVFCDAISQVAQPDDPIWIHDYHLLLLSQLVRERIPNAKIGFFLHIPFPSFEVFRLLPWRKEIIEGLLGADLIGFHTYDYMKHFLSSVRRITGHEHSFGQIMTNNRIIKVDVFPMGIDYKKYSQALEEEAVQKEVQKIQSKIQDYKVILSIDRMDYTKGISRRLEAYELFLEKYPEYREQVVMILVAVPSRTGIDNYILIKRQLDEQVGQINGKYGTLGWIPIWYLTQAFQFNTVTALYHLSDVALVTPLRDGMNLIAKEFIATKTDRKGFLVLSEMAGAASELGESIIVNPNNVEEIAKAIKDALEMPEEEKIHRNSIMQKRIQRYHVQRWASDFMERLIHTHASQQKIFVRRLTSIRINTLVGDYQKSRSRLLYLDYDGTLVSFVNRPDQAIPDEEIKRLLVALSEDPDNEVVLISGRDKNTLQNWFGNYGIHLIAEHGVWRKIKEKDWELIAPLTNEWKSELRPLLEFYVDRTPGALLEEKEYSLVWHYRRADPDLALLRARELIDALYDWTANHTLSVLEGNKVIEVKNSGIDKGKGAMHWLKDQEWDFILAIGDDWTDEDLFEVLPAKAYTVKVGLDSSKACYYVENPLEVRSLLHQLVERKVHDM